MSEARLGRTQLGLYALPAVSQALQNMPVTVYIAGFYSTQMALPLALVGLALSVSRITDIFTDILLGLWSDRLRTRWGRRRPMIVAGLPLAVVSAWLLFVPPDGASVLYLVLVILLFNLGTSLVDVPYGAWGAELSRDYDERTKVTAWRSIAATMGSFLALSIPLLLVQFGREGPRDALLGMALFYAILHPLFLMPLLLKVREPPPRDADAPSLPFRESVMVIWRNKAFRILSLGLLLFVGGKAISSAMNLIFLSEVVGRPELFPIMLVLENICGLAAVPAWMWLAKKTGKHGAMMAAALWSGLWSLPLFFLGTGDGWLFVGLIAMRAVSLTSWVMLIPSMTADAVDEDTLAAGRERTGLFFGALNFAIKAAAAIGILVGTTLPAMAGFQPSDPVHTPEALLALKLVYAVIGPLLVVAAAFCFGRFPIDRKRQAELRAAIGARAAGAAITA